MTPGQRRTLWLCVFALTFIFWYEARGAPLIQLWHSPPLPLHGPAALARFWQHFAYGCFFLLFGALLTVLIRRKNQPAAYHWLDWLALAVGLGLLAGTAWVSYAVACINA
jgi:hypothetical protein